MSDTKISIPRLRRFIADADAAHAAMQAASTRFRDAKSALKSARDDLEVYDASRHARNANARPGSEVDAGRPRLVTAVSEAQAAFEAAQIEYERTTDAWRAVSPLATSARDFARARGVLPADLKE